MLPHVDSFCFEWQVVVDGCVQARLVVLDVATWGMTRWWWLLVV
jgi:hypothetical protein